MLNISYQYYSSPFGSMLIASSNEGIIYASFTNTDKELKQLFKEAVFQLKKEKIHEEALLLFENKNVTVPFHFNGTEFQIKVWKELLKIPYGKLSTYSKVAKNIKLTSTASRAVGTAIGDNIIAYFVPCHRVVRNDGTWGEYRWGRELKTKILEEETGNKTLF